MHTYLGLYYCMTSTSYHIATRVLANLGGCQAPEGDKLAKPPRGHVITGLLQYEHLHLETMVQCPSCLAYVQFRPNCHMESGTLRMLAVGGVCNPLGVPGSYGQVGEVAMMCEYPKEDKTRQFCQGSSIGRSMN